MPTKDKYKHGQKEYLRKRKENHICLKCGAPASDGHVYCEKCLQYYRDRAKRYYRQKCIKEIESAN